MYSGRVAVWIDCKISQLNIDKLADDFSEYGELDYIQFTGGSTNLHAYDVDDFTDEAYEAIQTAAAAKALCVDWMDSTVRVCVLCTIRDLEIQYSKNEQAQPLEVWGAKHNHTFYEYEDVVVTLNGHDVFNAVDVVELIDG